MTGGITNVIVDATNIGRSASWRNRHPQMDDNQRFEMLVHSASSWATQRGVKLVLVFDGMGAVRPTRIPGCEVLSSGRQTADDVVERQASMALKLGHPYWIVSGDRAVRLAAGAGAERVLDPDSFITMIASVIDRDSTRNTAGTGSSRVGDVVSPEVRSRLERLRRRH